MITNSEQYLKEQYKNSSNLDIRIRLHELYTHSVADWHEWVFDNISFEEKSNIIEFGCGSGALWAKNLNRVHEDWCILLSDTSEGMLHKSKQNTKEKRNFTFQQIDVQHTKLENSVFDIAIANHMLYHVPDINQALIEIRRILKPKGKFYTATNGLSHMREIYELIERFDPSLSLEKPLNSSNFCLENGAELLGDQFEDVKLLKYESHLRVTNVLDLVEYMFSMDHSLKMELSNRGAFEDFISYLESEKNNQGYIHITKASGLFICNSDNLA